MESNNKSINDIYTPLEDAKKEIWERWNKLSLRKEVHEFLGEIPASLKNNPKAYLPRHIVTPNMEYAHFVEKAKQLNLRPISGEYLEDIFVTNNYDKLGLGRMPIFLGRNKKGKAVIVYRKIIDLIENDGEKICEIKTLWGESLVDFH